MPILYVHLYLPRRAGDVTEVGRSLGPDAGVEIDRQGASGADYRADREDTEARPSARAVRKARFPQTIVPEGDEEQQQSQLQVRSVLRAPVPPSPLRARVLTAPRRSVSFARALDTTVPRPFTETADRRIVGDPDAARALTRDSGRSFADRRTNRPTLTIVPASEEPDHDRRFISEQTLSIVLARSARTG